MDIDEADMEDLKEDLKDIDEQLKEIEEVNNRNYKIDESYLELYSEYFNMLD